MVSFFINFGVVVQRDEAILFTGNHGRGPGLPDLGAHVPCVVGPVGQYGLARTQVRQEQARRLRAVAGLAAGQGQGANPALRVATQVEFGGEPAATAAKRLADGAVFFFAPPTTWCARTAVESTMRRCKPVAFCTWASTCGHTPAWRQRRNRAYTVCQGPNLSTGKSRHDTPQRARQSTASTNKRVSLAVVPGELSWPGSSGESRAHCASVNILRSLFMLKGRT